MQVEEDWDRVLASPRAKTFAAVPDAAPDAEEARMRCFERCLEGLKPAERQMVVGYYQDDRRAKIDNRRTLAERLGVNMNTLRIRVMRTQRKLERCVGDCEAGA